MIKALSLCLIIFIQFSCSIGFSKEHTFSSNISNHNKSFKEILELFEKKYSIPNGLLKAICYVESRHSPWVFNSKGVSYRFTTKESAVKSLEKIHKSGFNNNHVGCMQINWMSHKNNFKNVDQLITPYNNIEYAAKMIAKFYKKTKSWERAVQYYHSSPKSYTSIYYQKKVFGIWEEKYKKI